MISNILFLSLLGITIGGGGYEPCGVPAGCYCSTPVLSQIQCLRNVTVFPVFEDIIKPGVLSIVFHGSKIAGLPPFEKAEWDRLKHLSFVDTELMSCDAIAELKRPGLRIFSECVSKNNCTECIPEEKNNCNKSTGTCLIFVALLFASSTAAVGYSVYVVRTRRRPWILPVPQTTPNISMTSLSENRADAEGKSRVVSTITL